MFANRAYNPLESELVGAFREKNPQSKIKIKSVSVKLWVKRKGFIVVVFALTVYTNSFIGAKKDEKQELRRQVQAVLNKAYRMCGRIFSLFLFLCILSEIFK